MNMDSLRGSSVKIGTIQRRLAWPLRKDDAHKSRSVNKQTKIQKKQKDLGPGPAEVPAAAQGDPVVRAMPICTINIVINVTMLLIINMINYY